MLVKEFLPKYPNSSFRMMTPGGYVGLTPDQAKGLLSGECVKAHPGNPKFAIELDAEELLLEPVESVNWEDEICYMMTRYPEETEQEKSGKEDASVEQTADIILK